MAREGQAAGIERAVDTCLLPGTGSDGARFLRLAATAAERKCAGPICVGGNQACCGVGRAHRTDSGQRRPAADSARCHDTQTGAGSAARTGVIGHDASAGERSRVFMHVALRHAAKLRWAARVGHRRDEAGCVRWALVLFFQPQARPREDFVLGCVTNVSENLQSCIEDGRRPPEVDFQELTSNHPELLRSKGAVVNVRGKGVREGRQVSVEKMSESEPFDDASSIIQGTVKTGAAQ